MIDIVVEVEGEHYKDLRVTHLPKIGEKLHFPTYDNGLRDLIVIDVIHIFDHVFDSKNYHNDHENQYRIKLKCRKL
jgi:hypothetical protein